MDILVNVANQKLNIATNLKSIVSGTQEFVRFAFSFTDDWDGLMTFAQFRQDDVAYNQYLDDDNCVFLPPEIKTGTCTLMLYGSNENIIATTNYLTLYIDRNILVEDAQSTDISTSLYNQLVSKINAIDATSTDTTGTQIEFDNTKYSTLLDFIQSISVPGKYTFYDDKYVYQYELVKAGESDNAQYYGFLRILSNNKCLVEFSTYVGTTPETVELCEKSRPAMIGDIYDITQSTNYRISFGDGFIGWHSNTGNKIAICVQEDDDYSDSLLTISKSELSDSWNISCVNSPKRVLQVNSSSSYAAFYESSQVSSIRIYESDGNEITSYDELLDAIGTEIYFIAEKTNTDWYVMQPLSTDGNYPTTRIVCTKISKNDGFLSSQIKSPSDIIAAIIEAGDSDTYAFSLTKYQGSSIILDKFAKANSVAIRRVGNGGIMNDSSSATGDGSIAIGEGTSVDVAGGFVGGRFNASSGKLFALGKGSKNNPSDAFYIDGAGNVKSYGYVEDGEGNRLGDVSKRVDDIWYGDVDTFIINKYPVTFVDCQGLFFIADDPFAVPGEYTIKIGNDFVSKITLTAGDAGTGDYDFTFDLDGKECDVSWNSIGKWFGIYVYGEFADGDYSVRLIRTDTVKIPARFVSTEKSMPENPNDTQILTARAVKDYIDDAIENAIGDAIGDAIGGDY